MIVLKMSILIDSPNPMFITNCNIVIHNLLQYWKYIFTIEWLFLGWIINVQDAYILHNFETILEIEDDLFPKMAQPIFIVMYKQWHIFNRQDFKCLSIIVMSKNLTMH
jgi:hypothetical protein